MNNEQQAATLASVTRPMRGTAIALIALIPLALLANHTPGFIVLLNQLAHYVVVFEDVPVALPMALALLVLAGKAAWPSSPALGWSTRQAMLALCALALLIWLARRFFLFDIDLSRDEQMVQFDAEIYARAMLFQPILAEWRPWYEALNPTFLLPIGDHAGWVSSYLPLNAALRAGWGLALPRSLVSPLLVLGSGAALWGIARRLWPQAPSTQTAVMLLFIGSAQVFLTGTTVYAMNLHLALNLVWLLLYLQGTRRGDAGAIAIGFLATGIHQPFFHPVFVAPFLLLLLRQRAWRRLAVFSIAYAAIFAFWLGWPLWLSAHAGAPPPAAITDGISFIDRFRRSAAPLAPTSFYLTAANLLRFMVWQHLLLIPLAAVGILQCRKAEPLVGALLLGIVLTTAMMLVLLPAQGHGWGYRYLHGLIGNAVLLAGFGWHWLARDGAPPWRLFKLATAASLLVLLPAHLLLARHALASFAAANAQIAAVPADIVVVDIQQAPFSANLVINRADLSNRPIRLMSTDVTAADFSHLCAAHTLGFAGGDRFAPIFRYYRITPPSQPSPQVQALMLAARAAGCQLGNAG